MRTPQSLTALILPICCALIAAADEPGESQLEQSARWEMETLQLEDGRTLSGLMQKQTDEEIEFVEVVRRSGRPMYLVVHYHDPQDVKEWTQLKAADRTELEGRIGPLLMHKNRRRIEAGRMEDVRLIRLGQADPPRLAYAGEWFNLGSTADENTTLRAVVRLEQMFRAYHQILPPRVSSPPVFSVLLLGSREEYRRELSRRGLKIKNPAFYSPHENRIVAGDDLRQFAVQLQQAQAENEQVREEYAALNRDFIQRLNQLAEELKATGLRSGQIQTELRTRRGAWNDEYDAALAQIATANRRNEARCRELGDRVFARLYHEMFHAYYENYVFPRRKFDTPRWLHEGIAQVFETGQVEADTLRIDAPDRAVLTALQQDLQGPDPLSLAELLTSPENKFLAWRHDPNASQRYYVYSWGLAWYLAFDRNLLSGPSLEPYVSSSAARLDPIPRFERFVGEELPSFEKAWRAAMLDLKAR